jgi:asparagine synthase (glutamine-hydrolysing)
VWERDGREVVPDWIERMLTTLEHRGPDARGLWCDGPVALGHQRLAILDPSHRAHQPLVTPDGLGVLVYNGEVYNYRELGAELERRGVKLRSSGDTEVVLHALHELGPAAVIPRFNGMFGLAYWDLRERALWLARDRLGIKPLYTAVSGARLAFASEMKALLAHPEIDSTPDLHVLSLRLVRGNLPGRRTPFRSIEALEPGTHWKVTANQIETRRWFDPVEALDVDRLLRAGREPRERAVTEFQTRFAASVHRHLASDAPVAAACSGGVDSSLIAALARRERPELVGYVAAIEGASRDAAYAAQVGRHLGLPIRRVELDRFAYARLATEATWHHELPLAYPASTALMAVTRACRADGVKVMLTGEGADELFGGYRHYATVHRRARRRRRRRWLASRVKEIPDRRNWGIPRALDAESEERFQRLSDRLAPIEPLEDRMFLAYSLADFHDSLGPLLHHHDRMGMAASIEMRVPFLENDVIDLALHLPCSVKLRRGEPKWVVKRAAEAHLPRNVLYARKRGFRMPAEAHQLAPGLLRGGALADVFRWSERETEAVLGFASGPIPRFRLTSFELWARLFLRGEPQAAVSERFVRELTAS